MTKSDDGPPIDAARWLYLYENDCPAPATAELPALATELTEVLRHPDPDIRDGAPCVVLRTWIQRDVIDKPLRAQLGTVMADRFDDPEIQARTFAPLVLDMIVGRGDFDPAWLAAFRRWFPAETDLRGYDPELGWLHAVAHGADLLGAFGLHPDVDPKEMLALAAERLVVPTDELFAQQEDDRLAQGVARTLTRPELSEAEAVGWLDAIETDFAAGRPARRPHRGRAHLQRHTHAADAVPPRRHRRPDRRRPHPWAPAARGGAEAAPDGGAGPDLPGGVTGGCHRMVRHVSRGASHRQAPNGQPDRSMSSQTRFRRADHTNGW
ncbi:DUF2785 domain-containing protein [Streptomyces sp. NBC_00378]|uniref:DUF2785 domain-containing protein n=1 Tax=unclassified Streptomyces TaxID=2593676 RepID=UPI00224F9D45|nr:MULTISPECIES: DUF2785 domain-containing protein [unclassified Streptomyces]MCX5113235.1 DUF2785 domain-containing protein [Streptomyces sp. NBC_00378]